MPELDAPDGTRGGWLRGGVDRLQFLDCGRFGQVRFGGWNSGAGSEGEGGLFGCKDARKFWGGDEAGVIVAGRQDQAYGAASAFVLVDVEQALTQRVDDHANDGVSVRIEVGSAAEGLGGDRVLLDVMGAAGEALLADVGENAGEIARSAEDAGGEEPIDFVPFQAFAGRGGCNVLE